MALAALLQLGIAVAIQPARARENGLDQQTVGTYADSQAGEQITTASQLSDLRPDSWAYQALANLVSRYGCVAGYPNGSFLGGRPISRYEAAALLSSCLDRVSEVTDELKRLIGDLQPELAMLRGKTDGLEARIGAMEAQALLHHHQVHGGDGRLSQYGQWRQQGRQFGAPGACSGAGGACAGSGGTAGCSPDILILHNPRP
jgi:hypothetical protein